MTMVQMSMLFKGYAIYARGKSHYTIQMFDNKTNMVNISNFLFLISSQYIEILNNIILKY
ncbi:MAG: hypothetical protein DRN15_01550 [Thermoprotei archaeon]|nr:MAG: hypothetical protein DRN15_01550 [Thermoprotei archaeon]